MPPEINTAKMTRVGFFVLVRKRGSVAALFVGDGVAGENWIAVPLEPTGEGVWVKRGGSVALACPIGVLVGV